MNRLYYGDNLDVLRRHVADESVDLIYLDPPFNSNRDYNVLFSEKGGSASPAQINAFTDTWHWDIAAELAMTDLALNAPSDVTKIMEALRSAIGDNELMAYLAMMAPRLVELHRVLKSTGSFYLHCDPTASHYLKVVLDSVFGASQFRNELVWKRAATIKGNQGQGSKRFGNNTDSLLFYTKTQSYCFNPQFNEYRDEYISTFYKYKDPDGRAYRLISMIGPGGAAKGNPFYEVMGVSRYWRYSRKRMQELVDAGLVVQLSPGAVPQRKQYLDQGKGAAVQSLWDDISALSASSNERLGYPTQKPIGLLERILSASSNPGDIILDPFCGCGTAVAAAEKLGRQWIGIDITYLAIAVMKQRFRDHFANEIEFEVVGDPQDAPSAVHLFQSNPYQFQWWAVDKLGINARPYQGKKKGADGGIDGEFFYSDERGRPLRGIVQVKGGKTGARDIRDLRGTMERERVEIGIFVSNQESTADMRKDAASAGFIKSGWTGRLHPRIQLLTVDDLFDGKRPDIPYLQSAHAQAPRIPKKDQGMIKIPLELLAAQRAGLGGLEDQ